MAHHPPAASISPVPPPVGHSRHCEPVQPQALHTVLGRGCMVRAWLDWGWWGWELHLQAGMRGQAGTKLYKVTGRALEAGQGDYVPFPGTQATQRSEPGPLQLLLVLTGCRNGDASGAGMLSQEPTLLPTHLIAAMPCAVVSLHPATRGGPGRGVRAREANTARVRPCCM